MQCAHHDKKIEVLVNLRNTELTTYALLWRIEQLRATGRYIDIHLSNGCIVAEAVA